MSEEGAGSQQLQPYTAESDNTELLPQSSSDLQEHSRYKNLLQEYTQKSAIQLPVYQTNNEGSEHYPRFRSTVKVDGSSYTSPSTFSGRKAAEQDVARVALEVISQKTKDAQCPLIHQLIQDSVFCKSILNEYASKMKLEKPTYSTIQQAGLLPSFVSSCVFNGGAYTGNAGKNKKEAEQLAARTVILSILETCSGLHPRPTIPVHEFKKPNLEPIEPSSRLVKKFYRGNGVAYYALCPNELAMLKEGNIGSSKLALEKNGFALPRYSDFAKVAYVLQGKGLPEED